MALHGHVTYPSFFDGQVKGWMVWLCLENGTGLAASQSDQGMQCKAKSGKTAEFTGSK